MGLKYEPASEPQHRGYRETVDAERIVHVPQGGFGRSGTVDTFFDIIEQPLHRNVQWVRDGRVFEAHSLLYHSA